MRISTRTRYEVLQRDDYTCRYCGGRAPDVQITVKRAITTSLCGSDDPSDLVAACLDCNTGRASTPGRPARCEPFPYMDMFDTFLDATFDALGISPASRKIVDSALWDAMPEAYRVYTQDGCGSEDTQDWFTGRIASDMARLAKTEAPRGT